MYLSTTELEYNRLRKIPKFNKTNDDYFHTPELAESSFQSDEEIESMGKNDTSYMEYAKPEENKVSRNMKHYPNLSKMQIVCYVQIE